MKKRKLLQLMLIVCFAMMFLAAAGWVVLFQVNSFSLVMQLMGEPEVLVYQGEMYTDPGADVKLVGTKFFCDGIDLDISPEISGNVDVNRPGYYEIIYTASFMSWDASASRTVRVVDTVPPSITLKSVPGHYTNFGEPYQEEGYSAWDEIDGDLTEQVTCREEDGYVVYSVEDQSGNCTTVARKIYYVDLRAPELILLGGESVSIDSGEGFTDPGWTAMDNLDGDLAEQVNVTGFVDKYIAGSYQLCYSVGDQSGNCAEVYRTVLVQAKDRPETVVPSDRVIYLTFDDGPGPYTEYLLKILDKYNAKATFFVVNTEYIDVIEEIVSRGHSIGIHCIEHDYRKIYESSDAFFEDLLAMKQIIFDKTGTETYLLRFPGGSSNTVSRFNPGIMSYLTQAVEDMGFQYFDWNVDSDDAGRAKNAQEVYKNVIKGVQNHRISIVLQHDIKDFSVNAVEKILIWGTTNGYRFLGLDMTSPTAHHGVNN